MGGIASMICRKSVAPSQSIDRLDQLGRTWEKLPAWSNLAGAQPSLHVQSNRLRRLLVVGLAAADFTCAKRVLEVCSEGVSRRHQCARPRFSS
jgi:hypothetical protein